jgi:hypothetical protein
VLTRDGWTDHKGHPYCTACYTHKFGPKGFGQSVTGQSMEPGKRPSIGGPGGTPVLTLHDFHNL